MNRLVSITITTRNEEKNIDNCLRSILAQTYQNIEIIVVDNGSSDRTKEIAQKYTSKFFEKGPERSAQRNFGMMEKSDGEFVLFLDADMVISPDLVEKCVLAMEEESVLALHIPEIVLGRKFFSKVRRFERTFYNGTVIDGARFFRKTAFVKAGGFDESMSGPEDWDIDKKIKGFGKIGLLSEKSDKNCYISWPMKEFILERGVNPVKNGCAVFHNESEFDLKKYLSKKAYYAKSFDTYIQKWGKNDPDIRKQFGIKYRFLGVFIEKGKWFQILKHPVLTGGMFFLRFMVGLKFLFRK